MNLKTQYKRLFEARVSSNDAKLLRENNKDKKLNPGFINEANELVKAQSVCKAAMFQLQKDVDKLFQDMVKAGYLKSFTTKITPWNNGYELSIKSKDNWKAEYSEKTPFALEWAYSNTRLTLQPTSFFEDALENGKGTYLEAELFDKIEKRRTKTGWYTINSKADIPKAAKEYIKDVRDQIEIVRKKAELYESLNESGVVNTGNAISQDLTNFLKEVVIPKSKGYVHDERDAAALLYDVLRHRYNLG